MTDEPELLFEPFPSDESDPVKNYHTIRKELSDYTIPLHTKPEIVCVSKAELTGSEEVRLRLQQELGREVLAVSAVTGHGLANLVRALVERLAEVPVGSAS